MSTGKHTAFTQCIEHLVKHSTIRNSAHRKPSTVFFNSSSGTTIAEALNIHHISIFGICEDVRHFSLHSNNVTINSHNSQLTLHTDSHASDSGTAWQEGRTILGAQAKYSQMPLSRKLFRMIDDMLIAPVILDNHMTGQNYLDFLQNELPKELEDVPLAILIAMHSP